MWWPQAVRPSEEIGRCSLRPLAEADAWVPKARPSSAQHGPYQHILQWPWLVCPGVKVEAPSLSEGLQLIGKVV